MSKQKKSAKKRKVKKLLERKNFGKGKSKIEVKFEEDNRRRNVLFCRRKKGMEKRLKDIHCMKNAEYVACIKNQAGRIYCFSSRKEIINDIKSKLKEVNIPKIEKNKQNINSDVEPLEGFKNISNENPKNKFEDLEDSKDIVKEKEKNRREISPECLELFKQGGTYFLQSLSEVNKLYGFEVSPEGDMMEIMM